jgi:hypothetical protein
MTESADGTPMEEALPKGAGMDRRAAIKKGIVGSAIAGVVWSAPRVEGLSLRPDYAEALSNNNTKFVNLVYNGGDFHFSKDSSCGAGTFHVNLVTRDATDFDGAFSFTGTVGDVVSCNADGADVVCDPVGFNGGINVAVGSFTFKISCA